MQTQLYKVFKKSSEEQPFIIFPIKFDNLGDFRENTVVSDEYFSLIRHQKVLGARQFLLHQDLMMFLTKDLIGKEDVVLLNFSIDDPQDVIKSVIDDYLHSQYHEENPQYKLLFKLFDSSKEKTTWYICKYLQKIKDRYYQISIRSNGLISFTVLDSFTEKDYQIMDELAQKITNYLTEVF